MLEPKDIDLNLLVVFQEVYQERQISAVARKLALSQPAISNALARLRRSFDDELFVRTTTGMQPTALAEQLAEPVALALNHITQALNRQESFDPASSKRHFTIAMTDVGEVYFMPLLAEHLHKLAPNIQLATVRASDIDLKTEMESGRVDLAIGAFDHLSDAWYQRRLFRQNYVCLFRQSHPLAAGKLELKDFLTARHLIVASKENPYAKVNQSLEKAGIIAAAHLRVPHFVAVPYIVSNNDLLVTVPQKLAERAAQPFGLRYVKPPLRLPALQTNMFWHRRYNQDAANQWMRSFICERFLEE
ncbi:LysR family transcriptional regulator [Undibacterium sp. TS12]|uniref:LysR family transcriptional regulator n=1 Tax=Undibacterium sp. TS12 TaxID=2908202 RepID=UPI001F4CDAD4|nr:LysR family transcriptional regulator [Undibacterium sp. TS12]MCH8617844.1 LysR family transcriptional regulator [Undibacterium sp. TS12]